MQILLSLVLLLTLAFGLGRIAVQLRQPPIIGEILAGIIAGPTIGARVLPSAQHWLFDPTGPTLQFLDPFSLLGGCFLMLAAGLEMGQSTAEQQRKPILLIGALGMIVPFALGLTAASLWDGFGSSNPAYGAWSVRIFFATALSISALPVIVKTLMDLNLLASRIGTVTIAAASINDIFGWIIFSAILSVAKVNSHSLVSAAVQVALTIGFALVMLKAAPPAFAWFRDRLRPSLSTVFSIVALSSLAAAAFTDWIGIHAFFGAFFAGIAWSRVGKIVPAMRAKAKGFVVSVFAPLFFASMGLKIDLLANFSAPLVAATLFLACLGKIGGCRLGGFLSGMPARDAWAISICLNARGAVEIVLGLVAYQVGLIGPQLFVALLLMAVITSILVGVAVPPILSVKPQRVEARFKWVRLSSPAT